MKTMDKGLRIVNHLPALEIDSEEETVNMTLVDVGSFFVTMIALLFALASLTSKSYAYFRLQSTSITEQNAEPPCSIANGILLNSSEVNRMQLNTLAQTLHHSLDS